MLYERDYTYLNSDSRPRWDSQGWSRRNGALDFAGGTVVHISSGAAVAAMAVYFGIKVRLLNPAQREAVRLAQLKKPQAHNITYVVLGTVLLWVGWFGFNGGSALGANARAVSACISTQTAACFGSVTSLALFWIKKRPANQNEAFFSDQVSTTVFCDGAIVGLVAITPAAGYVSFLISSPFYNL
jgi:Amt family ammonium transporter